MEPAGTPMTLSPGDIVWAWSSNVMQTCWKPQQEHGPRQYVVKEQGGINPAIVWLKMPGSESFSIGCHISDVHFSRDDCIDAYGRQAKARYCAAMATVRRLRKEGG